ncbi:uncharacterized protein ACN427_000657 isoform 1-T4 [Glossina fuscipes fuscipes]
MTDDNSSPPSPLPKNEEPLPQKSDQADKQTDASLGRTTQDIHQNHTRPPLPHELTAEWTVKAQLKFARAGETVRREFSSNDPVNPVRVVYKWSTFDVNTASPAQDTDERHEKRQKTEREEEENYKRNSSRCSGQSQDPSKSRGGGSSYRPHESFRSTTSSMTCGDFGGGDSAFSGSNTSHKRIPQAADDKKNKSPNYYGTRCRSTCNIVVSAVADFLPCPVSTKTTSEMSVDDNSNFTTTYQFIPQEETDPFVFNTTASYTVLPEKSFVDEDVTSQTAASGNFASMGKILNLRDAFCQTSDTETKYFEEHDKSRYISNRSPLDRLKTQRSYDPRDRLVDEGHSFMPSYLASPSQTFKSASLPRMPFLGSSANYLPHPTAPLLTSQKCAVPNNPEPQKKPRTVHIDVYCTGSEEDQADAESSSSDSEAEHSSKRLEVESNSTFQTVLENEQMRLRHQRVTDKQALPRRLAQQQKSEPSTQLKKPTPTTPTSPSVPTDMPSGHAITKSSTAEEVHESKQLLFRKHVGDQRAIKLHNLRQKYLRQSSDDALSLGYPNSSRSTVRDNTCSSVSSVLAADTVDSAWKEAVDLEDTSFSLAKSDSFEYENALDRLRIRQMESLWSRNQVHEEDLKTAPCSSPSGHHLQTISEVAGPLRQGPDILLSESENFSETENFFPASAHFLRDRPGFLQFFGPQNQPTGLRQQRQQQEPYSAPVEMRTESTFVYPAYSPSLQRWKSEARDDLSGESSTALTPKDLSRHNSPRLSQRSGSEAPPATTSARTFPVISTTSATVRRFELLTPNYHSTQPLGYLSSPPGYSTEYLDKARKFGDVVVVRKPGHHVGPTKNPNCSCECCQRWLNERIMLRGRAFSLGERPLLKRSS